MYNVLDKVSSKWHNVVAANVAVYNLLGKTTKLGQEKDYVERARLTAEAAWLSWLAG